MQLAKNIFFGPAEGLPALSWTRLAPLFDFDLNRSLITLLMEFKSLLSEVVMFKFALVSALCEALEGAVTFTFPIRDISWAERVSSSFVTCCPSALHTIPQCKQREV